MENPKEEPKQDLRKYPLTPDECFKQETLEETLEEAIGKRAVEYCKQYEGTDKYNVAMLAIEFGYQLKLEEDEK